MGGVLRTKPWRRPFSERIKAFHYLMSNIKNINSGIFRQLTLIQCGEDEAWVRPENLHNKLSDLVENPNPAKFCWNYAILWQLSRSWVAVSPRNRKSPTSRNI